MRYILLLSWFAALAAVAWSAPMARPRGQALGAVTVSPSTVGIPTVDASIFARPFTPGSLLEAEQRALYLSQSRFSSVDGTASIVLARPILDSELGPLGLIDIQFPDNDPPLAIIIVRANFGWSGSPDGLGYMGYIFDLLSGGVMADQGSADGSIFSRVLQDSNIPTSAIAPATPIPAVSRPTYVQLAPGDYTARGATMTALTPGAGIQVIGVGTPVPGR
jgi:hypothetical protein